MVLPAVFGFAMYIIHDVLSLASTITNYLSVIFLGAAIISTVASSMLLLMLGLSAGTSANEIKNARVGFCFAAFTGSIVVSTVSVSILKQDWFSLAIACGYLAIVGLALTLGFLLLKWTHKLITNEETQW